jgi:hypothetical protein
MYGAGTEIIKLGQQLQLEPPTSSSNFSELGLNMENQLQRSSYKSKTPVSNKRVSITNIENHSKK